MTEDGTSLGMVGNVTFNRISRYGGHVSTPIRAPPPTHCWASALIPADLVKGFRRGMGAALAQVGSEGRETDEVVLGAMLVDDAAKDLVAEGGVAEKAGAVTAVAVDKVHTTVDRAKPVVSEAAKKTGEVVNKGAYATGKQIAATKGMFSGFKEEYDKARGVKPGSDDQALAVTDEAEDEGVSAPAKPASTAPKKKTTAKKPAPKKNMFAAFKEEYDKARHDD